MATKPDLIKWVSNDDVQKIIDPGASKKANGFIYQEKPAFQYVNYLFNRFSKWVLGLQGAYAQVVVGSSSQVTDYAATHAITQLNDAVCTVGSKILLLEGSHLLTANLTLTADNLIFDNEGGAIINLNGFNLTISGANCRGNLRFTNVGTNTVTINGSGTQIELHDIDPVRVVTASTSVLKISGATSRILLRNASVITETELTAHKDTRNAWTKAQDVAQVTLTDAVNIATDAALSNVFQVTLAGNRTLNNPTNLLAGQTIIWNINQDATGGRTIAYGNLFKFANGALTALSTGANAKDTLSCVYDGTILRCSLQRTFV